MMDDHLLFTPSKRSQTQTRRPVEGIIEEWAEDISKEMPIVQNKLAIHGY